MEKSKGVSLNDWDVKIKDDNLVFRGKIDFKNRQKMTEQIYIKIENKYEGDFWIPALLDHNNVFVAYIPVWRLKGKVYSMTVCIIDKGELICEVKNISGKLETPKKKIDTFNVAFIGGISNLKGAKEIKKIIESAKQDIRWYIIGDIGDADLLYYENKNLTKLGRYNQESLQLLLQAYRINAIGILSIWPETFSYTLSEAFQMGIPVFATDIGALGERIYNLGVGKAIPYKNITEDVLSCLNEWITNKNIYQNEVMKYKKIILKSQNEMCLEYQNLYGKYFANKTKYSYLLYNKEFILSGLIASQCSINCDEKSHMAAIDWRYVQDIQNSITWKVVTKIINMRFPFKEKIYTYLMKRNR